MKLISSADAAKRLGVHITRVQVLIREGRLPAIQVGGTYVIQEGDLKLVANRKPGRPTEVQRQKTIKGATKRASKRRKSD